MIEQSETWQKGKTLKEFIDKVKSKYSPNTKMEENMLLVHGIDWGTQTANRIDPLI